MIRTTIVELGKSKGPKKRAIIALDPCADNTNIDEDLAKELNLPIFKSGIRREVDGLFSTNSYTSNLVQVYISPFGSDKKYPVLAYTVKNLLAGVPIVDWEKESHKHPYLRQCNPVKMEPGDKFGILLGTDNGPIQLSDAKLFGQPGEPYAERTDLGWAFSGPVKNAEILNGTQNIVGLTTVSNHHVILSTFNDTLEQERVNENVTLDDTEQEFKSFERHNEPVPETQLVSHAQPEPVDSPLKVRKHKKKKKRAISQAQKPNTVRETVEKLNRDVPNPKMNVTQPRSTKTFKARCNKDGDSSRILCTTSNLQDIPKSECWSEKKLQFEAAEYEKHCGRQALLESLRKANQRTPQDIILSQVFFPSKNASKQQVRFGRLKSPPKQSGYRPKAQSFKILPR